MSIAKFEQVERKKTPQMFFMEKGKCIFGAAPKDICKISLGDENNDPLYAVCKDNCCQIVAFGKRHPVPQVIYTLKAKDTDQNFWIKQVAKLG